MNKISDFLEKAYKEETSTLTKKESSILLEYDANVQERLKNINLQLTALRRRTPENMANPTIRARKFAALMKERKQLSMKPKKIVVAPKKTPMIPGKENI